MFFNVPIKIYEGYGKIIFWIIAVSYLTLRNLRSNTNDM
jgi:hypothetical protein